MPAFYSSSKAHSENRFIRVYLFLQKKFGSVTNTVTLSLTTLMVYGLIAAMLRTTIFTYNLDKQYRANDETSKCEINSTITQGLSDGHYDTQKLDQSTLHKLDVGVANANDDDNEDINSIDSQGNEIDKRPVEFAGKSACCTIF